MIPYLLIRERAEGERKGGAALVDLVEERTGGFHLNVVRTDRIMMLCHDMSCVVMCCYLVVHVVAVITYQYNQYGTIVLVLQ